MNQLRIAAIYAWISSKIDMLARIQPDKKVAREYHNEADYFYFRSEELRPHLDQHTDYRGYAPEVKTTVRVYRKPERR